MHPVIETKNLFVHYGQTEVLNDISFTVTAGDFIGLAGPNGAGKSTLIKAILGLLPISKGTVKLFGQTNMKFADWGKIGYLPQKSSTINVIFPATVNEVISLGLLSQKRFPRGITTDDRQKVDIIMNKLAIAHLSGRLLSELSGGQQQRVLLARALVSGPQILIFDEPSTALDPSSRQSFFTLLQQLNKDNGTTIILITHDTGDIGKYAHKLLYIDKQLVYYGDFSQFCVSNKMNSYFGEYEQHHICHQHD